MFVLLTPKSDSLNSCIFNFFCRNFFISNCSTDIIDIIKFFLCVFNNVINIIICDILHID